MSTYPSIVLGLFLLPLLAGGAEEPFFNETAALAQANTPAAASQRETLSSEEDDTVTAVPSDLSGNEEKKITPPAESLEPERTTSPPTSPRHPAGPIRFSGYSTSRAQIHLDAKAEEGSTPENYGDIINETLIEASYDAYTVGLRKNLVLFFLKNNDPAVKNYDYRYSPEAFNHGWMYYLDRLYASGSWRLGGGDITVRIGDFYESMNRGLFFSMLRTPGGEDNAVRGGEISFERSDFHVKTFGGVANPFLRDRTSLERMGKANDTLWGAEAGWRIAQMLEMGVEYGGAVYDDYTVHRQNWDNPDSFRTYQNKYFHLVGFYADLFRLIPRTTGYLGATLVPAGADRLIQEAAWGETRLRTDLSLANALYFSFTNWHPIAKSRLTLTLEGKRYERYWLNYRTMEDPDYTRRYFNPPSLTWDNLLLLNDLNTMGLRARAQLTDNDITGLTAAIEFVGGLSEKYRERWQYKKENTPHEDHWFVAGSLERKIGSASVGAKAGYRAINSSNDPYNGKTLYANLTGGIGVAGFSAKFNLELYRRDLVWLDTVEEQGAIEQRHILDLSWRNSLFLSYVGTFYRNKFETLFYAKDEETYYPGGSIGYAYRNLRLSLFGGFMRGGLTCIGGICRNLPDFKGIKLELDVKL